VGTGQVLLRQEVAALLNAAHPQVHYPLTVVQVILQVKIALVSLNALTMTVLSNQYEVYNDASCPVT
jgi:hypothetical protein